MARSPIYLEVKDAAGNAVASPTVNVKYRDTGTNAPLFLSETGATTMSNPATGDALGRFLTWVDRGFYNCLVSGTGITSYTIPIDTTSDATLSVPSTPLKVGDTGVVNQISAGHDLALSDFSVVLGAPSTPALLSNLGSLTNLGTGGALSNRNSVSLVATGIMGVASSCAQFNGTDQVLYIADTGGSDPFHPRTMTWGAWVRSPKKLTQQYIMSKTTSVGASPSWQSGLLNNVANMSISDGSFTSQTYGVSDICDDRWHHVVSSFDGSMLRLYVDGVLEGSALSGRWPTTTQPILPLATATGPFNIGGRNGHSTNAATDTMYGRIDEPFFTPDVLTAEQIRLLYCAKIPHGYGRQPARSYVAVRRAKRGGAYVTSDFPSTPVRLYNFTAGSLADSGSSGAALAVAAGTSFATGGADGSKDGGLAIASGFVTAADTGLPSGTNARSYGAWYKAAQNTSTPAPVVMAWGTQFTAHASISIANGFMTANSGADTIQVQVPIQDDGQWHFLTVVEDNAAVDGLKRKAYVDGRCFGTSTTLNTLTLNGTFTMGESTAHHSVDGMFVYAGALTSEQIRVLYNKGSGALDAVSVDPTGVIELMDSTYIYGVFKSLGAQNTVDISVSA